MRDECITLRDAERATNTSSLPLSQISFATTVSLRTTLNCMLDVQPDLEASEVLGQDLASLGERFLFLPRILLLRQLIAAVIDKTGCCFDRAKDRRAPSPVMSVANLT